MSGTQPYTGDKTRIVISFANKGGGDLFAHWLRDRLMKTLCYYSENAVYLDNVASRNGGTIGAYSSTGATFDTKTDKITTSDGSYLSIGARHDDWDKMWKTALSEAKVVIQIQTTEFFNNTNCADENKWINTESGKNAWRNLVVLALGFDKPPVSAMGKNVVPTEKIPVNKVPGNQSSTTPLQHLKDSWVISESDYLKVAKFVTKNAGEGA